jgi:Zn-dependent protease with chaperone function
MSARWLAVFGIVLATATATSVAAEKRSFDGYAEWRYGDALVVDGQRIRIGERTEFKGKGDAKTFGDIPLGYEVKVEADRVSDGWLARKVEAKPNGRALFEDDLRREFDEVEVRFRDEGRVFEEDEETGEREDYGRLLLRGPEVDRVERLVERLVPPYVDRNTFRVYVVENEEWNAMAAPNGCIFVFTGLLENTDDDELAVILGHELAHVTHEHSRRGVKKALWSSLFLLGVVTLAEQIDSDAGKVAVAAAGLLGGLAWQNRYGRGHEDQADRVGLRYAYEGGFAVDRASGLWERFAAKYHDLPKAVHFFLGDHSRSIDRARTLAREVEINYSNVPVAVAN